MVVPALAAVLLLAGCVAPSAPATSTPESNATAVASPAPSATPTSTPLARPAAAFGGDCDAALPRDTVSAALGDDVDGGGDGRPVASPDSFAALSLAQLGAISCRWTAPGATALWATVVPSALISEALDDEPATYCYVTACSFVRDVEGYSFSGVVYPAAATEKAARRAVRDLVAALEESSASAVPVVRELPAGSWAGAIDCDALLEIDYRELLGWKRVAAGQLSAAGEAGPGAYASVQAAGTSRCGAHQSTGDYLGFAMQAVPGAAWALDEAVARGGREISVDGAQRAVVASDASRTWYLTDGVNLITLRSENTTQSVGEFRPIVPELFALLDELVGADAD